MLRIKVPMLRINVPILFDYDCMPKIDVDENIQGCLGSTLNPAIRPMAESPKTGNPTKYHDRPLSPRNLLLLTPQFLEMSDGGLLSPQVMRVRGEQR